MLTLAHSTSSANSTLLVVIVAAIVIVTLWRPLLKIGVVVAVILILVKLVSGLTAFLHGIHQVIH